MAQNNQKRIRPSILERLLDDRPDLTKDSADRQHPGLTELRESVRRDLEHLLNTRHRAMSPKAGELDVSLLNYGLPDLQTINFVSPEGRIAFCHLLEQQILQFEPRFKSVQVSMLERERSHDQTVRFRIEALMYAEPAPEEIAFDTALEPITHVVNIQDAH